jgi:hypothetical protein
MSNLYKIITIDESENTPVSYVGVHPLKWHKHPEQPQVAFMETLYSEESIQFLLDTTERLIKEVGRLPSNGAPNTCIGNAYSNALVAVERMRLEIGDDDTDA